MTERRQAVVDCGSTSFRLVVFTYDGGHGWRRTDEIYEQVRIGEGLDESGVLGPESMERALEVLEVFAHFCRASGITDVRPVATSAIRDATNQAAFLAAVRERTGLDGDVLSREREARYGYLAAVNSTTLADGVALDIGGGSMQLTRVQDRVGTDSRSWRLGAVRMTERFLDGKKPSPKQVKALRAHALKKLEDAEWLAGAGHAGRIVGVGGAVRNLATAAQAATRELDLPVQGVVVGRDALTGLIDQLAELPVGERSSVKGIKPGRADVILAAAVVIDCVLEAGGFDAIEATEAGLREGVFFETLLADREPPLFDAVRTASVRNLAAQYDADPRHTEHVAFLALQLWDDLHAAEVFAAAPHERELVWAAALLHDIGGAVDYDDHHKHSRYLVLSAGLPGFSVREMALVAQMVRYHRKGTPSLGVYDVLAQEGDDALVLRGAALLRVAEQLERARDQAVHDVHVVVGAHGAELVIAADDDATLARWATERQRGVFQKAFGVPLSVATSTLRA